MSKGARRSGDSEEQDDMTSTYTELNIRKVERLTNTQADELDPTYSQLNLRRNEVLIAKEEVPPLTTGPGAQAAAQERESKEKIGNRPYRLICLLCLVTSTLIVTVAGLSIHVSQIRHKFTEMETKYRSVNETKAQICELLTSRRDETSSPSFTRSSSRELCIPQPCVPNPYILDWKMRKRDCGPESPVQGILWNARLQSVRKE
ncbi:uncharacterized protein [Hemitrygon akajei]|uniref:uncharacterized protein n=1 Tax=Hemitrygon akajei TaxID=2704970 RepID=UPI003BF9DC03